MEHTISSTVMSGKFVAIYVGLLNRVWIFCVPLLMDHFLSKWGYLKDVIYCVKAAPERNWTVTAHRAEALVAEAGVLHFEHLCWIQ
jgi:hypothetical protein